MLAINDFELKARVDDAEAVILGVAAGTHGRAELLAFIDANLTPRR